MLGMNTKNNIAMYTIYSLRRIYSDLRERRPYPRDVHIVGGMMNLSQFTTHFSAGLIKSMQSNSHLKAVRSRRVS